LLRRASIVSSGRALLHDPHVYGGGSQLTRRKGVYQGCYGTMNKRNVLIADLTEIVFVSSAYDRFCGLVVRVHGY
jgi:hypothetical protein